MAKIKVYPHPDMCPDGAVIEGKAGDTICEALLDNKISIEHACELSCACTTCHVLVKKGFLDLEEASEEEEDMLDKAWGLEPESRLSCQVVIGEDDLEIELPRYTINMVSEQN
ncbi:ISC system 2Fe-2S type ferredoxin [Gammaproteobacteria bacterium]|nr:ISC system 2Fe-2S type ferredoxin [Gammaproteobacteria bacterium]